MLFRRGTKGAKAQRKERTLEIIGYDYTKVFLKVIMKDLYFGALDVTEGLCALLYLCIFAF